MEEMTPWYDQWRTVDIVVREGRWLMKLGSVKGCNMSSFDSHRTQEWFRLKAHYGYCDKLPVAS